MPKAATRVRESGDQAQRSCELRHDGQKGEQGGDVHLVGEEIHGATVPVAAEPAEQFLRAVGNITMPRVSRRSVVPQSALVRSNALRPTGSRTDADPLG